MLRAGPHGPDDLDLPGAVLDIENGPRRPSLTSFFFLLLFQVVRFIPALIVSEAQVDKAMSIFKKAVEEVAHEG